MDEDTGAMNQGGKGKCLVCEYKVLCSLLNSFQNTMVKNLTLQPKSLLILYKL